MESSEFDHRQRRNFYFHATPLRRFVVFAATHLFRLFMKLDVSGLENLPLDGAVIVAANHVTTFDVFPMQIALPRPIFYMGKAELFRVPVVEAVFRNLGAFPVFRGEKDQWAMQHAGRVLAHGQVLGMFPEGTRSKGKGLGVAKTGSARLAIEAGCPIVPIAISGSDSFFQSFPHRTRVTVRLLPAILPRSSDTPLSLTDRVMFALAAGLPEDMRGVYSQVPKGFGVQ
ncbi:MAG: lysophospholipid acyltransferase family protein [Bacteroidota bacterium]